MNNKYVIRVGHPLLRPGLEIETESSERYLVPVVQKLMQAVREINGIEKDGTTNTEPKRSDTERER
jgi:hypothetical protein